MLHILVCCISRWERVLLSASFLRSANAYNILIVPLNLRKEGVVAGKRSPTLDTTLYLAYYTAQ